MKNYSMFFLNFCKMADPGTSEMETVLLTKAIGNTALSYLSDFNLVNESRIMSIFLKLSFFGSIILRSVVGRVKT